MLRTGATPLRQESTVHRRARNALAALALVPFLLALLGCGGDAAEVPTATKGEVTTIDAEQAAALIESDREILVIDVRTVDEYRSGHMVGAQNIDAGDAGLWERRTSALDRDQPTIVYCQSGRRSAEAAQRLVDAGFTEVYDLGGIQDWFDGGELPVDES